MDQRRAGLDRDDRQISVCDQFWVFGGWLRGVCCGAEVARSHRQISFANFVGVSNVQYGLCMEDERWAPPTLRSDIFELSTTIALLSSDETDVEPAVDYTHISKDSRVEVRPGVNWQAARALRSPDGLMSLSYSLNDDEE
jgi:hypothetical protein